MRKIIMLTSITVITLLILASTVSATGLDIFSSAADSASDGLIPTEQPDEIVEPVVVEDENSGAVLPESISSSSKITSETTSDALIPTEEPREPIEQVVVDEEQLEAELSELISASSDPVVPPAPQPLSIDEEPIAIFRMKPCSSAWVNQKITLDGRYSYDPDGKIKGYYWWFMPLNKPGAWWDIGFGGPKNWSMINFTFTTEIMERVKEYTGEYTYEYVIILCVVDDADPHMPNMGYSYQIIKVKSISSYSSDTVVKPSNAPQPLGLGDDEEPIAIFRSKPCYSALVKQKITLDGRYSYDPDGKIKSYYWFYEDSELPGAWYEIGYGSPSKYAMINYSFDKAGTYTIILCVVDDSHPYKPNMGYSYQIIEIKGSIIPPGSVVVSGDAEVLGDNVECSTCGDSEQSESGDGLFNSISLDLLYGSMAIIIKQTQHLVASTK